MSLYDQLVMMTQENFSRYYHVYQRGGSPYEMSTKNDLTYTQKIEKIVEKIKEADCVIVGGASGLSSAGGGDFYYDDNESFRKYFGPFAKKYGMKGAFAGMGYPFSSRAHFWAYLATFLHTTQHAKIREPYLLLDKILKDKDFFVVTTNQDTQFMKLYNEDKVAEIQGDHRFFQCSVPCHDGTYDALIPVEEMYNAIDEDLKIPEDMIPRCPKCGKEMFPWVRGYGNFLTETKYQEEYQKISDYIEQNRDKKIIFIELGVGRMTPMFIQEPFWNLTYVFDDSFYISINKDYDFLPKQIEDKRLVIKDDITKVLKDIVNCMEEKSC